MKLRYCLVDTGFMANVSALGLGNMIHALSVDRESCLRNLLEFNSPPRSHEVLVRHH